MNWIPIIGIGAFIVLIVWIAEAGTIGPCLLSSNTQHYKITEDTKEYDSEAVGEGVTK